MTAASTNSIDSTSITNGTSNVSVASDADITLTRGGTARLTVTSSGATVTGTLTATAFSGDGSALTGITSFVSGMIIMFTGSTAPSGWAICDGTNGTPDLRDRFVVGQGTTYSINDTGAAKVQLFPVTTTDLAITQLIVTRTDLATTQSDLIPTMMVTMQPPAIATMMATIQSPAIATEEVITQPLATRTTSKHQTGLVTKTAGTTMPRHLLATMIMPHLQELAQTRL